MKKHIELALAQLKTLSVDAAEIFAGQSQGFSVSARLGEVELLEHHQHQNFSVTVFHQQRTGSASSNDFSENALYATIEKALSIARFSHPDPFCGLANANQLAWQYPNCELHHPWPISPSEAITLTLACEKKALSYDPRIVNSDGVSMTTLNSRTIYANTLGFIGEYQKSDHSIQCCVVASDGKMMQRDEEYTVARNARELQSADSIAVAAAEKTIKRLQARKIKTQICPVIFEASVAKSVVGAFVRAISGSNLYRQTSFLLNALGKKVFPDFIQITQRPHLLAAMGSRPFDHDGVATQEQAYIVNGELVRYVLGSYSARKLGLTTTGNAGGVFNLCVESTGVTLQQLLQKMHRGLLVTELLGQGVNITTGDYSRGAVGFWIENGAIQFPVEEITIAGNLQSMFAGIIAIADDIDIRSTIRVGSVLINEMTVAGI